MPNRFRSLRVRLLMPVLGVALLASAGVAVGSYLLGDRWAREELDSRYRNIQTTLDDISFRLSPPVIESIASLTATELVTTSADHRVLVSTFDPPVSETLAKLADSSVPSARTVSIAGRNYRYATIARDRSTGEIADRVLVFFDERALRAMRLRAAVLPLLTGLSTVILLTSVTLLLSTRLIGRLSRLQGQVEKIAGGEFETHVASGPADEIGVLGKAVTRMGLQLQQMWTTLQRQQGQKLLHQLAGGMAHQLRNSITGARMAIELHRSECVGDDESLSVALTELEQTEANMKRLLIAASGNQGPDHRQSVHECLSGVQETLRATAQHLHVDLVWRMEGGASDATVNDGPSLNAAVTNLVLNAMQAAKHVEVDVRRQPSTVEVIVTDDGDGPPKEVLNEIFEPFVTSKPEGLGLGLPLVAQSAKRLGGDIRWERDEGCTRFILSAKIDDPPNVA